MGGKGSKGKANNVDGVDYKGKPSMVAGGKGDKWVHASKEALDFNLGNNSCPINKPVFDEFTLTNNQPRKLRFTFEVATPPQCHVEFDPPKGTLGKKKEKKIKVKLTVTTAANLNFKTALQVEGGETHFLSIKVSCDLGVFGVDPNTLNFVDDNGFRVPEVLAVLRRQLHSKGGYTSEGIFRLAGDAGEIQRLKGLYNKKQYEEIDEINTNATLIKIWFRDLPIPVLNCLPTQVIFNSNYAEQCIEAYINLPELNKTLLTWLMDLLADVAENKHINKMTAQNLAIVVAPNLYEPPGSDPMEGLVMSQKIVQFLHNVLVYHVEGRKRSAAGASS